MLTFWFWLYYLPSAAPTGHLPLPSPSVGLLFSILCVEGLLLRLCTGWSIFLSVYQNYRLQNCLDTSQRLKAYFYIFQVEWGKITFLGSQFFIRGLLLLCHVQPTYEVSESSSLMFIIRPGPRLCEEVPEVSFHPGMLLHSSYENIWDAWRHMTLFAIFKHLFAASARAPVHGFQQFLRCRDLSTGNITERCALPV